MSREPIAWFSLKGGKRIPIFEGESKQDAIKRNFSKDSSRINSIKSISKKTSDSDKKTRDIESTKNEGSKLNNEAKYRDSIMKSSNVTNKDGKLYFKGKEVDTLDTSTPGIKGHDSLADHLDKNGNITPERMEVHRQIIEEQFKGHIPYAPGDEKVAMFTGGGGASGKGTFTKVQENGHRNIGDFYSQDKNPLIIDPDELKKSLAKADGHSGLDAELSGYYHEESSALAKQIYATSLKNSYPTLFDGTATGVESTIKKVNLAHQYGYKSEMCFVYSDWNTVRSNSLARYENTGRLVPLPQVVGAHTKAYGAVNELQDKFDSFKLYDNAGNSLKLVGSSTGKSKLNITNTASYNRFSKSAAEFTLSAKEIDRYNADADKITAIREKRKK